jgi:two-component system CheB/CheR fusion protein
MVMAQAPDTAEDDSMPTHAIATGLVDYVLPVEKMPAVLFDYIARSTEGLSPASGEPGAIADLEPVLRARATVGSDFRGYKRVPSSVALPGAWRSTGQTTSTRSVKS